VKPSAQGAAALKVAFLCLIAGLLAPALGACTVSPSTMARPVVTKEIGKCEIPMLVETWVDGNGNGSRDADDQPLSGVRIRLRWGSEPGSGSTVYLTADDTGHDFYSWYGDCGTEKLEPQWPEGYLLTTEADGPCLFSAPRAYGDYVVKRLPCFRYGFSPAGDILAELEKLILERFVVCAGGEGASSKGVIVAYTLPGASTTTVWRCVNGVRTAASETDLARALGPVRADWPGLTRQMWFTSVGPTHATLRSSTLYSMGLSPDSRGGQDSEFELEKTSQGWTVGSGRILMYRD
jgi:hypothetical protein